MDHATSCELAACYYADRKLIQQSPIINKYRKELEKITDYCDVHDETFYIMNNGRLGWYWESDSDFGGTEGVMEFCYSNDEAKGTWAYDEVKSLIIWIKQPSTEIHSIKSDKELLDLIRAYSKYSWVHYSCSECPVCGSQASEVYSRSKQEGFVYDGEAVKCENCDHTGYISVEDSECADVIWDNEDADQTNTDF